MDGVSGLANIFNDFGRFFTTSCKFGYTWIYLFHILYLSKHNREMMIYQRKTFNIFPGSIQLFSISKILYVNCNREIFDYIPVRGVSLNRPYFEISNSKEKICLTIDYRNFNSLGLAKYRTNAGSDTEQFCYLNQKKR